MSSIDPQNEILVFISYKHEKDDLFAEKIRNFLHHEGYSTWMDKYNIPAGSDWDAEIDRGLRRSSILLGVMSSNSLLSQPVLNEWAWAQSNQIPLVLVRVEEIPDSEIPHRYIRIQYIDFNKDQEAAYNLLSLNLRNIIQKSISLVFESKPGFTENENSEDEISLNLQRIQKFSPECGKVISSFVDKQSRFWVSDGQMVNLFKISMEESFNSWVLPDRPWKSFFPFCWNGNMLCADWDGGLLAFNEKRRSNFVEIHKPSYLDTPFHQIAIGEQGELAASTWDGKLVLWDKDFKKLWDIRNPEKSKLIEKILILKNSWIILLDQAGELFLLDSKGQDIWKCNLNGCIQDIWCISNEQDSIELAVLMNANEIIRIKDGKITGKSIKLPSLIISWSHRSSEASDGWTVFALEDGGIEWLSWIPFRLVSSLGVKLSFEIQQIIAVLDKKRQNVLLAVGINTSGQFFTIQNRKVKLFATPEIKCLYLDSEERFLFWQMSESIEVYRNPILQLIPCQVSLVSTSGKLIVGSYSELVITLKNIGRSPINRIFARLEGQNRIEPVRLELSCEVLPSELISLDFSVCAKAIGDYLPLELYLEMEDEAGAPPWEQNLEVKVESTK